MIFVHDVKKTIGLLLAQHGLSVGYLDTRQMSIFVHNFSTIVRPIYALWLLGLSRPPLRPLLHRCRVIPTGAMHRWRSGMPRTAEAAKAFNQQLRATAAALGAPSEDDHRFGSVSECGCGKTAGLTLAEYGRRQGARLEGHTADARSEGRSGGFAPGS